MSQWPSIETLAQQVAHGQVRAAELVEKALSTIDEQTAFNAVIAITDKRARERAAFIDDQVSKGKAKGRLLGVPFIAKDNFLTFSSETTAASNILKGFKAPYQATAIERLEAEGAICVAKANLDAFAHGTSTENSDFMTTKNPHNPKHVPGGSSGGSAAAVILDMVPFAVGTDTGGSIRQPASFCGAVGYKPTYGLVSRSGVVAMISSTDTIGPLARTVKDASLVLDVMSGVDPLDSTTIEKDEHGYVKLNSSLKDKKVGVIKEYMADGLDEDVKSQIELAVTAMQQAGARVQELSLPSLPLALASYYIVAPAEISSNLSRYDGQRYGYSSQNASDLDASYDMSRSEGFGDEAKRRIMIGAYVLSSGYYDAYFKKAQQLRTKIIQEFSAAFEKVDLLVGPVAPTTAFEIGKNSNDPLQMYLEDIMTVAVSLAGLPAVSVPAGTSKSTKLPVGLQIIAPMRHDRDLLGAAAAFEELHI